LLKALVTPIGYSRKCGEPGARFPASCRHFGSGSYKLCSGVADPRSCHGSAFLGLERELGLLRSKRSKWMLFCWFWREATPDFGSRHHPGNVLRGFVCPWFSSSRTFGTWVFGTQGFHSLTYHHSPRSFSHVMSQ